LNSISKGSSKYYFSHLSKINNYFSPTDASVLNSFQFSQPKLINSPINDEKQSRAYFTRIDEKQALICSFNNFPQGTYLNIQKTIYERNAWAAPVPIIEFTDTCFIAHPTISPNGDILVYSSNKSNANGNTDLWFASKQPDGTWSMFIPIDELNSNGNEITPFFVSDDMLIFASDGFDGIGGYDLYYSYYESGRWSKPTPIEGINTEFNESDPAILPNGFLLFASDRAGGEGKLDIYAAKVIQLEEDKIILDKFAISISATNLSISINKSIQYDLGSDKSLTNNSLNNSNLANQNETKYEIQPQRIQLFVKIDSLIVDTNHYNIDSIKYRLLSSNLLIEGNNISVERPEFIIDFGKHLEIIFNNDSLNVEIIAYYNNNILDSVSEKINIELIKETTKELKIYSDGNEKYYKIYFKLENDFEDFKKSNFDIIDEIQGLLPFSNKINIVSNQVNQEFVNNLIKYLNFQKISIIKQHNTVSNNIIEFHIFTNTQSKN
jgi:hypothetical protein